MSSTSSDIEKLAAAAHELPAFENVNLAGIRTAVTGILSLIGRNGLFSEYTLHDISHVDEMLALLTWMIPEDTRAVMTPADWLLVVLAVYFHDAGMVVTEDEYAAREDSGFRSFCQDELFVGRDGKEYRDKVKALDGEADRFLYEEFVRRQHADRIADWINGKAGRLRGVSDRVAREVSEALQGLPVEFRRDLALVCQSHHLNDLHDFEKYKVSQPYGNSDAETANVHYAALLLRSTDLLHIRKSRTPSVLYRLIDPQDPVSQREWAKQASVRNVRPQPGRDRDGKVSRTATRDTVEVHATFDNADGFFGLTSYLRYAERELAQTSEWASSAATEFDLGYGFPWRRIDDSEVTATGFLPKQLSFSLDQHKILDLLTGHTLYNDTDVVVRELLQNGLDAARLQAHIDGRDASSGKVHVIWNSSAGELTIRDNGTGMSQSVIERNLLRAGASRYQEEGFRREYPDFSPISRFGIGVLSAFMIADSVTITTCAPEERDARQLTLRSVHGRYLVKLLDKDDAAVAPIFPNGTEVRLRIRKSAAIGDVIDTLQRWVVVPRCEVTASTDGDTPKKIGYETPKQALEALIEARGLDSESYGGKSEIKVLESEADGITTAFAVRWSPYFREWAFVKAPERVEMEHFRLGTCIEGVRVEDATPGYDDLTIVAICNASGPSAPKTNVARSGIEQTPEKTALLERVYRAYFEHVANEARELSDTRGVSLTWAAQETEELLRPLSPERSSAFNQRRSARPLDDGVFTRESESQPLILVESEGVRRMSSAEDLADHPLVWTVDSRFVRAAEDLLREIPTATSISAIARSFGSDTIDLPSEPTLVGYRGREGSVAGLVLRHREPSKVIIRRDERRIDLAWQPAAETRTWIKMPVPSFLAHARPAPQDVLYVSRGDVLVDGRDDDVGVRSHGRVLLFSDTASARYLLDLETRLQGVDGGETVLGLLGAIASEYLMRWRTVTPQVFVEEYFENRLPMRLVRETLGEETEMKHLIEALAETPGRIFDTSVWIRRET